MCICAGDTVLKPYLASVVSVISKLHSQASSPKSWIAQVSEEEAGQAADTPQGRLVEASHTPSDATSALATALGAGPTAAQAAGVGEHGSLKAPSAAEVSPQQ